MFPKRIGYIVWLCESFICLICSYYLSSVPLAARNFSFLCLDLASNSIACSCLLLFKELLLQCSAVNKVISSTIKSQHGLLHAMKNKGLSHYHCLEKKEADLQEPGHPSLSQVMPLPQGSRLRFDTTLVPGSGLWFGAIALSSLSRSNTHSLGRFRFF